MIAASGEVREWLKPEFVEGCASKVGALSGCMSPAAEIPSKVEEPRS